MTDNLMSLIDAYAAAGFAEGNAGNHMFPFEIANKAKARKEARAAVVKEVERLTTTCGSGAGCCAQAVRIEELERQIEAMGNFPIGHVLNETNERLRERITELQAEVERLEAKRVPLTDDIEYYGLEPWERPTEKQPSPTAGMNLAQRILHVGGRNNEAGYVEFGSIQAVEALVRQVLRDLPTTSPLTDEQIKEMRAAAKADPRCETQHWFVLMARAIEAHHIGEQHE